ncbi:unnamed protein product [Spirodela intermedia]|uniref:MPN domain-containing protein n=1 Tax=Spirodela intermedia TaxID=51605 RepID=A0A7I8JQ99_SPIIN|nr:unnamed protein product [Spirodela intermedia]CAA6671743.1 unnamed protein product [Spirodela intermedia]
MALTGVKMTEEVWLACLSHALSTESEEIMGLLLGDTQHAADGSVMALIWGASPQVRSDRRKDRVETNPEQLAAASAQAEISKTFCHRMTHITGRTTRVIGWYHSHPHITVLPSHVDIRTQAMYQLLDSGFVGLIFSCFSEDSQKIGKIQVIAFQSLNKSQQLASIKKSSDVELESSWSSENTLSTSGSTWIEGLEKDSGDSKMANASKEWKSLMQMGAIWEGKIESTGVIPYDANVSSKIAIGMDLPDMTASMQEALHRSNMDVSGAEYIRKEIPLQVLPNWSLFKFDSPLSSFTAVQHVLFEEEQSAYNQSLLHNTRDGNMHPLAFVHHTSTYQASLCKLMEYCLIPAINVLQDRLKENEIQLAMLTEEAKSLELEVLGRESRSAADSQRRLQSRGSRTTKPTARGGSPSSDFIGLGSEGSISGRSRNASQP